MKLRDFTCKKCKSRAGFIFQPKKQTRTNLKELSRKLEKKSIPISALTPLLLVVKFRGTLFSFYQNGKVIVGEKSERKARTLMKKLLALL